MLIESQASGKESRRELQEKVAFTAQRIRDQLQKVRETFLRDHAPPASDIEDCIASFSEPFILGKILYNADEKSFFYSCQVPLKSAPDKGTVIIRSNFILVRQDRGSKATITLQPKAPPLIGWPDDPEYHIVLQRKCIDNRFVSEYAFWKPAGLAEHPQALRPYLAARICWTSIVDVPWRLPIIKYHPLPTCTNTAEVHPAELCYHMILAAGDLGTAKPMIFAGTLE